MAEARNPFALFVGGYFDGRDALGEPSVGVDRRLVLDGGPAAIGNAAGTGIMLLNNASPEYVDKAIELLCIAYETRFMPNRQVYDDFQDVKERLKSRKLEAVEAKHDEACTAMYDAEKATGRGFTNGIKTFGFPADFVQIATDAEYAAKLDAYRKGEVVGSALRMIREAMAVDFETKQENVVYHAMALLYAPGLWDERLGFYDLVHRQHAAPAVQDLLKKLKAGEKGRLIADNILQMGRNLVERREKQGLTGYPFESVDNLM